MGRHGVRQIVRAETAVDARRIGPLEAVEVIRLDRLRLLYRDLHHAELAALGDDHIENRKRGHHALPLLDHQLDALLVEVEAVLDRVDAGDQGVLDALGALGVGRGLDVGVLRLLDEGPDLLHAVLAGRRLVLLGHDAARGHDLEEVGALAELLAGRLADLADPVCQPAQQHRVAPLLGNEVPVAVARGLGDDLTGGHDAGADDAALGDRPLEEDAVHAADLADGGEARVEHPPDVHDAADGAQLRAQEATVPGWNPSDRESGCGRPSNPASPFSRRCRGHPHPRGSGPRKRPPRR